MLEEELGAEELDYAEFMRPFIKSRVAVLRDNELTNDLQMRWPEGCPGPSKYETDEQTEAILDVLDKIEADYGIAFSGDDPRGTTGHSTEWQVTNKAPGVVQKEEDQ